MGLRLAEQSRQVITGRHGEGKGEKLQDRIGEGKKDKYQVCNGESEINAT